MERWMSKVAVVTGASSGIGKAVAEDLIKAGFTVVALARRFDRLQQNKLNLPSSQQNLYYPIKCDVSNESQVKETFEWIEKTLGGTDVLINNAGVSRDGFKMIDPASTDFIRETIDVNLMAVVYCVREAFTTMKKRDSNGHIVIVNSIDGHKVPNIPGWDFNAYPASKFAVTAMTETYRQEFINAETKVKITSISPGAVATEMVVDLAAAKKEGHTFLMPEDISSAILFILSTPPHVQIHELIIKPVGEKF